MKKSTKQLLITGAAFCGAGLVMFGAGMTSGGREYVKNADLNVINGAATLTSSDSHAVLEKTEIDSFSTVNADLRYIDLKVKPSPDDKFYISYNVETSNGVLPVSYQISDGTLNLVESKGNSSYSYIHIDINFLQMMLGQRSIIENQNNVVLYIPKNQKLESFSCNMGDGYLNIDSLRSQKLLVSADYGDINLKDLDISEGSVSSSDGDLEATDSLLRNTSLNTDYGDMDIQNTSIHDGEITLSDGDLTGKQITFSGETSVTDNLGDISLSIPQENLDQLSVNAKTSLGDLTLPDSMKGSLTGNDDAITYTDTVKFGNQLNIKNSDGDIQISVKK